MTASTSASSPIQTELDGLRSEKRAGAEEIARRAARLLVRAAETLESGDPGTLREKLWQLALDLPAAQPTMAPLYHLASVALDAMEKAGDDPLDLRQAAAFTAHDFLDLLDHAPDSIAQHAMERIPTDGVCFTHSASSAVRATLRKLASSQIQVICTESRPMLEGQVLARALVDEGLTVRLIPDAGMGRALQEASVALVGADILSADGLINKTGTYTLALCARVLGIPLFVLCSQVKLWPAERALPTIIQQPAHELISDPPPKLNVDNRYFDVTPLELVSAVVTESGWWTPEQVRQASANLYWHAALDEIGQ